MDTSSDVVGPLVPTKYPIASGRPVAGLHRDSRLQVAKGMTPFTIVTIREQGQNPTCSSRIRPPRPHRLLPKRQNSMSQTCLPRPRDRALPLALRSELYLCHPEVLARILHFSLVSNKTHHPCGSSCKHHASEQGQFCQVTRMAPATALTFCKYCTVEICSSLVPGGVSTIK